MVCFAHGNPNMNGMTPQHAAKALLATPMMQVSDEGRTAATELVGLSERLMNQPDRSRRVLLLAFHVKHGAVEQMEGKGPP